MSERTVKENADETFNLLKMCLSNGINNFILQELVKRHTNTIICGGKPNSLLVEASKMGDKVNRENRVLKIKVAQLERKLELIKGELDSVST